MTERQRVGEEMLYPSDEVPDHEIPEHRYFRNKPLLTRLAVITAGPFANLILAVLVMIAVAWIQGRPVLPSTTQCTSSPGSVAVSKTVATARLPSISHINTVRPPCCKRR